MHALSGLQNMLEEALTRTAEECSILLGQELSFGEATFRQLGRDAYIGGLEDASCFVGIEATQEYEGRFYAVFALRDAIVLSSALLGIPAARISEKKRLAIFEPDDADAFSEIANQVTGSFNAVFKSVLPKKVHLKQLAVSKFVPQEDHVTDEVPIPAGDYYICDVALSLVGYDMERVELLIPLPLATQFDLRENEAAALPEEHPEPPVEEYSPAQGITVLILDDDPVDRRQLEGICTVSGGRPMAFSFNGALQQLLSAKDIQTVILGLADGDETELAQCTGIVTRCRELSIPVIVCARQWTRTSVLKATQHGMCEILLKSCSPDTLRAKITNLLAAS